VKRLFFVALLVIATCLSAAGVSAQASEPTAIIDRALADLGARLSLTLTRGNVQSYQWEQKFFANSALECPVPGTAVTQVQTLGYSIIIRVRDVNYDYRATSDGSVLLLCQNGQPAPTLTPSDPNAPTPVNPTPVPGTANPPAVGSTSPLAGIRPQTETTTYNNPIAFIALDGNLYVGDFTARTIAVASPLTGDATGVASNFYPYFQPKKRYTNPIWSPDGTRLAWVDQQVNTVYLAGSGQPAAQVAASIASDFPVAWSSDGGELAYAVATSTRVNPNDANSTEVFYQIQAIPAAGGAPRAVGQFPVGVGCGGGGVDGTYIALEEDLGYSFNPKILAQVANGYLYSSSCLGIGVGLTNLNGTGTWKRADLAAPALSPDRARLAAIVKNTQGGSIEPGTALELVDLATGAGTKIAGITNVTNVAWSPDGLSLYYSTLTPAGSLAVGEKNVALARAFFPEAPFNVNLYTAELFRVPVAGGAPVKLFSREARGIGRIGFTADGANAVITVVPSYKAMNDALAAGAVAGQVLAAAPRPEITIVPLNGSAPSKLVGGSRFAIARGLFIAQPVSVVLGGTAPEPGTTPPNLAVGQNVVITVKAGSLNLRDNPSTGARIKGYLPKDTVVTIIGGPINAEGYRWWQVRAPSGNEGWVADQIVEDGDTVNTLTPQ
jgi:hypothetical protein